MSGETLQYAKPDTTKARRLVVRLLIIAAVMFVVHILEHFGLEMSVWFEPANAGKPPEVRFRAGFVDPFQLWRSDFGSALFAACILATCISLLLLSIWAIQRCRRWGSVVAWVVCVLLGTFFCLIEALVAVGLVVGAWHVFHGAVDGTGLEFLQHLWLLGLGIVLLCAVRPLWLLQKADRRPQ